jgi:hypothetical protein
MWKKITLAALTGTALLAAAPAFADGYRDGRHFYRGDRQPQRVVVVRDRAPFYRLHHHRPAVVHRPVVVHQPAVIYREPSAHQVLGGLILGTVIGVAIANHAGY